jgi:hypothetical protein
VEAPTPAWAPPLPEPDSSVTMGLDIMMSERMWGPGGMFTKWLVGGKLGVKLGVYLLSLLLTALMKASSFSVFSSCSPKFTTLRKK